MTQQEFIERYQFSIKDDNIGGGSFGTVYKAYDTILDREVAIKISEVKIVGDKEFSLLEEFKAIENIPPNKFIANYEEVFRFESFNGIYDYGLMQYYSLGNLSSYLKNNEVSLEKRESITKGILEGIAFLHKHKVVHRDLKPSNILVVDRKGIIIPKITDFGLSKQAEGDGKASRFTNSFAGGTLQYSSPEQLKGLPLKLNTDLWSFGVIAYEILTGKTLFETDSQSTASAERQNEITQKILHVDVSKKLAILSIRWQRVVTACLERDVNKRLQDTNTLFSILKSDETPLKEEVLEAKTIVKELKKDSIKVEASATENNDATIIKGSEKKIQETVNPKSVSSSKTISKDNKKKLNPLIWLVVLFVVVSGVLFVLKPWEEKIDPELQKQFITLKVEANLLAKQENWQEALNKYQEANKLLLELVVQDSIASLTKRLASIAKVEETKIWQKAKKANTIKSYKSYLAVYKNGFYKAEADSVIASIESYLKSAAGKKKLAQEQAKERLKKLPKPIQSLLASFVYVRGGTFTMGCSSKKFKCDDDELPTHRVSLSGFSIGKYEVTQAQWQAVMKSNPSSNQGCDDCPVEQVSYNDTQYFIKKLNKLTGKQYRLPTEAEWEFAARGGIKSIGYQYSGSNSGLSVGWYKENSGNYTHSIGQKQANELGLYDMSGNVAEWCSDWYGENYYTKSHSNNPKGPSLGLGRCVRGGSYYFDLNNRSVSNRSKSNGDLDEPFHNTGFRLVLD
jgi:formylglycine-generating enzyme required for sulfatase activity/serine/threonine protein kinase